MDLEAFQTLVANGTTLFTAVATLAVTMIGFGILVKVVKKLRG